MIQYSEIHNGHVWKTANGRTIPIQDMDEDHLLSCYRQTVKYKRFHKEELQTDAPEKLKILENDRQLLLAEIKRRGLQTRRRRRKV